MKLARRLDQWEAEIADSTMLRPSAVQNNLLDIHDLVDSDAKKQVERWLGGSVDRSMYAREEVDQMIRDLRREAEPSLTVG